MSRVMVLGMLSQRPMHGYEIQQELQRQRSDLWANLLPNTIYHALRQMNKEELICVNSTEQMGNRTRVIYEITPAGREEFQRLLKESLGKFSRKFPSELYTALTFIDKLSESEVMQAVEQRIEALEKELIMWNEGEKKKTNITEGAEAVRALFENGKEHIRADLKLMYYVKENLPQLRKITEDQRKEK